MKIDKREKRKKRVTLQIKKNNKNGRNILNVFRSNKNITAQIIDLSGNVLVVSSSSYKDLKGATSINIGHLLSKLKPQIKIVHILALYSHKSAASA